MRQLFKSFIKLLIEFGPLLAFFVSYKLFGLVTATATMMIATIFVAIADYLLHRKIAYLPLITTSVLSVLGTLTIVSGDPFFMKIKPTIVNSLFALILFIGAFFKKGFVKYLLGHAIQLTDQHWVKLSLRWACFFLFLAMVNEYVWRHYSEEFWVSFKVFGMFPLSLVFMFTQLPFICKNRIE